MCAFYDNRKSKGIKLVKKGTTLLAYRKETAGPSDKVENFFDSSESSVNLYSWRIEEVEKEPGNPKDYLRIKGNEEDPNGISFWVLVDFDNGEIKSTGRYR